MIEIQENLLRHHIKIIQKLAEEQGNPAEVVDTYYKRERLKEKNYGSQIKYPLVDLVTRAKSGQTFTAIPESEKNGDVICSACKRFGKECWHGHTEYILNFPSVQSVSLKGQIWDNFSMDILANKKIDLLKDPNFHLWYKLPEKNNINSLSWRNVVCEEDFLPTGVEMMRFISIVHPAKTVDIARYLIAVGFFLSELGGPNTEVVMKVNDTLNGTSMRPEGFRYKHQLNLKLTS